MTKSLEKLIEELAKEALDEANAISAGGGSLQPSGQVSGTGGNPLGRDMSDQHEIMWSGDEPEKKKRSLKEEVLEEDDLDEISAIGTGAVVGYTLPLGMKPDHETMGTKKKKKKRPRRWYDVHKESRNRTRKNEQVRIKVYNEKKEKVATAAIKFDGKIAFLDSVFVVPEYHKQGIGKQLYKEANVEAKKQFGVPLTSSDFLTPHSKKMWYHLSKEGAANKVSESYQMKERELDEQVRMPGKYNWGLHPIEGPHWWKHFSKTADKMVFAPHALTQEAYEEHNLDIEDKGIWGPASMLRGPSRLVLAYPKEKKIDILTNLRDPRLAYLLSTSLKYIPELADFKVYLASKSPMYDEDKFLGNPKELLAKIKVISGRSPQWSRDDDKVEYTEFKFEVLEDVDDVDWYHATSLKNLDSIKSKGLLTSKEFEQGTGWTQLNLHLQDAVYLTSDEDYALRIAETLLARTGVPGLVLKVSGQALKDKEKLIVDEDRLRNQYDSMLSAGELLAGMPDYLSSVLDSKLEAVGYKGKIDPGFISPAYVVDVERDEEGNFAGEEADIYTWQEWKANSRKVDEEFIGKRGGVSYFQIGGSLPDHLYNRTDDGKPTRDPGVVGLKRPKKKKK